MNDLINKIVVSVLVVLGAVSSEQATAFSIVWMKYYNDPVARTTISMNMGNRGYQKSITTNEVGVMEDEHFPGRYFVEIDNFYPMEGPYEYAYCRRTAYYVFPLGSNVSLTIDTLEYETVPYNLTYGRISKEEGEPSSASIPSGKYLTGRINYSTVPVEIVSQFERDGAWVVEVEEYATLCNSSGKDVKVMSKLTYSLNASEPLDRDKLFESTEHRALRSYMPMLERLLLQSKVILQKPRKNESMLIISTPEFQEAVDLFSEWKKMSGYNVKIEQRNSWTSATVQAAVQKFSIENPDTQYVVIIGDHEDVPGMKSKVKDMTHITDYYYGFKKGNTQLEPDFHLGRIPAGSSDEATNTIYKIITTEKNPPVDSLFYKNYAIAAYFQSDSLKTSHEDNRYLTTSEKIRDYLVNKQDKKVERIYKADEGVTPKSFNDNTPLPAELLSPEFNWNQGHSEIISSFNTGKSLILHRDHGMEEGWYQPNFTIMHLSNLKNKGKLPLVLSLNCKSGDFASTCFAEKILSLENAGCSAIIAPTNNSKTYPNDELALGLINAIWPSPGLVNANSSEHCMFIGDVVQEGLNYMGDIFKGTNLYQREIFHIFGDPSMRFFRNKPKSFRTNVSRKGAELAISLNRTADITGLNLTDNTIMRNFNISDVSVSASKNWKILISGDGLLPVTIENKPEGTITLQNEVLTGDRFYFAKYVDISSSLNSDIPYGPVVIESGTLTIEADEVNIFPYFEVKKGACLEIK